MASLPPPRVIRQQVQSGALLRSILGSATTETSTSGPVPTNAPEEAPTQMDVDEDGDVPLDDVSWLQEPPPRSPYSA